MAVRPGGCSKVRAAPPPRIRSLAPPPPPPNPSHSLSRIPPARTHTHTRTSMCVECVGLSMDTYECYARVFVCAEISAHTRRDVMGSGAMPAVADTCASQHRLIAYDIEYACVRVRMRSVSSRDSAAVSTADVRGDSSRRYRPCAQLHTCAVRICARARDSALTANCVLSRWAMVLTRACVRPVCLCACVRACARVCAWVCVRGCVWALPWHGGNRRYL
jgi:hypothetical protein